MPEPVFSDWKGAHGATQRALKARKGPATDDDRPPPSTFPGRRATVLDGQLSLESSGARLPAGAGLHKTLI
jgi:hypothetical protein